MIVYVVLQILPYNYTDPPGRIDFAQVRAPLMFEKSRGRPEYEHLSHQCFVLSNTFTLPPSICYHGPSSMQIVVEIISLSCLYVILCPLSYFS